MQPFCTYLSYRVKNIFPLHKHLICCSCLLTALTYVLPPSRLLVPNIHSVPKQTDRCTDGQTHAVITSHARAHTHTHRSVRAPLLYTPKCKLLFGRHCRRRSDRQTEMEYGVQHHPRKLLSVL
jgi:hypothetical protein